MRASSGVRNPTLREGIAKLATQLCAQMRGRETGLTMIVAPRFKRRSFLPLVFAAVSCSLVLQAKSDPLSRLDQPASAVLHGVENLAGKRCDYYGEHPRCGITDATWADFDTTADKARIDRVVIMTQVADFDRSLRFRSAKPGAIRAFGNFFATWPGSGQWIAQAYDKALVSKTRRERHLYNDEQVPNLPYDSTIGPPETTMIGSWVVHVYKDLGPVDHDWLFVAIDIRRKAAKGYDELWTTASPPDESYVPPPPAKPSGYTGFDRWWWPRPR